MSPIGQGGVSGRARGWSVVNPFFLLVREGSVVEQEAGQLLTLISYWSGSCLCSGGGGHWSVVNPYFLLVREGSVVEQEAGQVAIQESAYSSTLLIERLGKQPTLRDFSYY